MTAARKEADTANQSQLFNYTRVENPLLTQNNRESAAFGSSEQPRRMNDSLPFAKAAGVRAEDDDLARANTMARPSGQRETFGNTPLERATVKFGQETTSGLQRSAAIANAGPRLQVLEPMLQKNVYAAITDFAAEAGPDFPGVSLSQTQTVLRRFMAKHGTAQENEIINFFENNCIGPMLYYRETLLKKFG